MLRLLAAAAAFSASLGAADLSGVGPVYFWPMSASLDQYLAERAVAEGVFPVTADPQRAKSIMTDRIDGKFLEALNAMFPPEGEAGKEKQPEPSESSIEEGDFRIGPPRNRPLGNPKGTLFLVDVSSRRALWSTFLGEYERTPEKLNEQARIVVERLKSGGL